MVGENTFGKNTVQQRFALSNSGALRLTIARWLTPEGHDFGSVGVTPDVRRGHRGQPAGGDGGPGRPSVTLGGSR